MPAGLTEWILSAGGLAVAAAALYQYLARPVMRLIGRIDRLIEIAVGSPPQGGLPARPGIVDRLTSIERELHPNGGSSMRDAITRIEERTHELTTRADTNQSGIEAVRAGQEDARRAAEQAARLAADVHAELHEFMESGYQREQAYVAMLAELGIDLDPPPRHQPRHGEDDPE